MKESFEVVGLNRELAERRRRCLGHSGASMWELFNSRSRIVASDVLKNNLGDPTNVSFLHGGSGRNLGQNYSGDPGPSTWAPRRAGDGTPVGGLGGQGAAPIQPVEHPGDAGLEVHPPGPGRAPTSRGVPPARGSVLSLFDGWLCRAGARCCGGGAPHLVPLLWAIRAHNKPQQQPP